MSRVYHLSNEALSRVTGASPRTVSYWNAGTILTRLLYEVAKDPLPLRLEHIEFSTRDSEGQVLALGLQLSALVLTPQEKRQ